MPSRSTRTDPPVTPPRRRYGPGDTIDLRDHPPGRSEARRQAPPRQYSHEPTGTGPAVDGPPRSAPAGDESPVGPNQHRAIRPYPSTRLAVRAFDLGVAVTALVVLSPLLLILAAVVKIDSPGPVLYGSPRIGRHGTTFTAWKFRSMHRDAERQLQAVLAADPAAREEYARFHKLKSDPRLTGVGRLIRRTSLDELPQLVNIIRGEMSVVGPRPNLLSEGELFGPALPVVLQVRPGLTGLWQVSGRNRLSVDQRVILDLKYATRRTLGGDLLICWRTFLQLWRPGRHGGY
ncbi:MAG: sugar transferase [Actinomycetota bacterium]